MTSEHDGTESVQQGVMPAAEVDITPDLVRRLLLDQHRDLADLRLEPLAHGWDNVLFRLGPRHVVRLPRREIAAGLVAHEQAWLPVLAPRLPLPIPVPERVGQPTDYFPWTWSVQPWLDGAAVGNGEWADAGSAAQQLGQFLSCLHQPAPPERPVNPHRGGPLAERRGMTEDRIERFSATIGVDKQHAQSVWEQCLAAAVWEGPPMWIHGDLHLFNLIQTNRRLSAVIDFGDICGGDPACDLAIGWYGFGSDHHQRFRAAATSEARPIDADMWQRSRGWSLSIGFTLTAFSADNPSHFEMACRMVRSALADPNG